MRNSFGAHALISALALAASLLAGAGARARDYPDLFPTPRGLSMGGALTAFVDDHSSLSYNPAGLALLQESQLRLPDLLVASYSPDILDVYAKIQGLSSGGGGASAVSALKELDGVAASFGLDSLGMGWFRPRMAIAFQAVSMNAALRIRTPSLFFAKINARVTSDSGMSLGYAQPFFANHVRVGFAFRPVLVRGGFERVFNNQDIAQLGGLLALMGVGWGFDGDVGVQGNLDPIGIFGFQVKILGGAVIQNLLAQDFHRIIKVGVSPIVPDLKRRGNLGIAFQLAENVAVQPTLSVEWRDIGVRTDAMIEHLCVGGEFILKPRTWFRSILRAHFARGNWGGGIAGRLSFGELEIGTYAVNIGKGPGIGVNRRNYLALSARW